MNYALILFHLCYIAFLFAYARLLPICYMILLDVRFDVWLFWVSTPDSVLIFAIPLGICMLFFHVLHFGTFRDLILVA